VDGVAAIGLFCFGHISWLRTTGQQALSQIRIQQVFQADSCVLGAKFIMVSVVMTVIIFILFEYMSFSCVVIIKKVYDYLLVLLMIFGSLAHANLDL
jgi:hypothetical protein